MNDSLDYVLATFPNISSINVTNTFTDDHIHCADFTATINGKDFELGAMWIGWEGVAALKYFNEAPSARELVIVALLQMVNLAINGVLDNEEVDDTDQYVLDCFGISLDDALANNVAEVYYDNDAEKRVRDAIS